MRRLHWLLLLAAAWLVLAWLLRPPPPPPANPPPPLPTSRVAATPRGVEPAAVGGGAPSRDVSGSAGPSVANPRLTRAKDVLATYLRATQYPPDSRPLAEHPDRKTAVLAHADVLPLKKPNGTLRTDRRVYSSQSHLFLVGAQVARLGISCRSKDGALPVVVQSAEARAPNLPEVLPVLFEPPADDPLRRVGVLAPLATFPSLNGELTVDVRFRCGDDDGVATFVLHYTGQPAAQFDGSVRETIEGGSLALYVGLRVRRAGRYVLTARVDDAVGGEVAWLRHDGALEEGRVEVRFVVFGKLVRDLGAQSPLRLRDLEGMLVLEDAHPDRILVLPWVGLLHTTQSYGPDTFSAAEWTSPDKERRVAKLTADVLAAGGP